jgi:hypothetical protein
VRIAGLLHNPIVDKLKFPVLEEIDAAEQVVNQDPIAFLRFLERAVHAFIPGNELGVNAKSDDNKDKERTYPDINYSRPEKLLKKSALFEDKDTRGRFEEPA